ncbi:Hypothetical predicted protein [Octopus vulgaris]|uniref:FAM192A/Fyv6 N-terminal domain-containing protein n=1 Tax=Octopus vulgaris TaxID=6645 RepID=A0AA36F1G1_OCTVU|nr:Hypothetical predicted protein [Octopus vulgaris]
MVFRIYGSVRYTRYHNAPTLKSSFTFSNIPTSIFRFILRKMSSSGSSLTKFVSEKELDEKRQQRQKEWEKVRQPDQPLECPEEVVDNRSLFDKLQEQKKKKEDEYEEEQRNRNSVKGLEEDEVSFLDYISKQQERLQKEREKEQANVMEEMSISFE